MTDWKALCKELLNEMDDHPFASKSLLERVTAAFEAEDAVRPFSDLTKEFDADRRARINARKQEFVEWSLDSFLDKYKDPVAAKRFLIQAGIIDENGQLAKPYRQEPVQ